MPSCGMQLLMLLAAILIALAGPLAQIQPPKQSTLPSLLVGSTGCSDEGRAELEGQRLHVLHLQRSAPRLPPVRHAYVKVGSQRS
jgi:hypothetical protein